MRVRRSWLRRPYAAHDAVAALVALEVQVAAAGLVRRHQLAEPARPLDRLGVVGRGLPHRQRVHDEPRVAPDERGVVAVGARPARRPRRRGTAATGRPAWRGSGRRSRRSRRRGGPRPARRSSSCGSRAGRRSRTGSPRRASGRTGRRPAGRTRAGPRGRARPRRCRPHPHAGDRDRGAAVHLGREVGVLGHGEVRVGEAELVRRVAHQVAEAAQQLRGPLLGVDEQPGEHLRPDGVQRELERGDDAEVPAAAAQRPQQVGVLDRGRAHLAPSAVTSSAASRLSQARPCLRSSQPEPPPSVRPATPVVETRPPVVARPCSCVARSTLRPGRAAADAGDAAHRVDLDEVDAADVDARRRRTGCARSPSARRRARRPRGPARGRRRARAPRRRATRSARRTGAALDHRVEEGAGVLVGGAAGLVQEGRHRGHGATVRTRGPP